MPEPPASLEPRAPAPPGVPVRSGWSEPNERSAPTDLFAPRERSATAWPAEDPLARDSYSWSARTAPPAPPASPPPSARPTPPGRRVSSVPPTAPMPKFTPTTWSVVVTTDREYYERMRVKRAPIGADLPFPPASSERRFPLTGKQMALILLGWAVGSIAAGELVFHFAH